MRELENEIERLVTLAEEGQVLLPEQLSPKLRQAGSLPRLPRPENLRLRDAIDQLEREMIAEALARYHGNKSGGEPKSLEATENGPAGRGESECG